MKKLILAVLVLGISVAQATEVTVLDADISRVTTSLANVNTSFQMDTKTGAGYVSVTVWENRYTNYGGYGPGYPYPGPIGGGYGPYPGGNPMPMPVPTTIYSNKVLVEGLSLVDNKVMFEGIDCGTLKPSPVFKIPTIYLSGNCDLNGKIVTERYNTHVVVDLVTK